MSIPASVSMVCARAALSPAQCRLQARSVQNTERKPGVVLPQLSLGSPFSVFFSAAGCAIAQWTSERELREMGGPYGTITSVSFKENLLTGKSLGAATVTFEAAKGARDAKEHIESREYGKGKAFKVTLSNGKDEAAMAAKSERVGRSGRQGGGGGGGGSGGGGGGGSPQAQHRQGYGGGGGGGGDMYGWRGGPGGPGPVPGGAAWGGPGGPGPMMGGPGGPPRGGMPPWCVT